jgi:hypothetical protein
VTTSSVSSHQLRDTRGRFAHSRAESNATLLPQEPGVPAGELLWHRLAGSDVDAEREQAALWSDSRDLIDYLSGDLCDDIRVAVAFNPETSIDTLAILTDDVNEMVADSAQHSLDYELTPAGDGESAAHHRHGNRDFYRFMISRRTTSRT